MTYSYGSGNLLTQDTDALVNTVNTHGVMGKGIALQFKKAWPDMFRAYAAACRRGEVQPGRMHVWPTGLLTGPRFIINFPTKRHWRQPSRIEDIEAGLTDLAKVIRREGIRSVALPPLGCGNGGLSWSNVEPLIRESLADVSQETDIIIFAPHGAPQASMQPVRGAAPKLTATRAALLALMQTYTELTLDPPKPIEVQKLAYFLQNSGQRLHLNFSAHHYGPYADSLRKSLRDMEGHFISGFGDGSTKVVDSEPIQVREDALSPVTTVVESNPETREHLDATMTAISGFESQYGLELLASMHWIMAHNEQARGDSAVAYQQLRAWSKRKATIFPETDAATAWHAIRDRNLVTS